MDLRERVAGLMSHVRSEFAELVGIDGPPVLGSAATIAPRASSRLNLRVPPGMPARDYGRPMVTLGQGGAIRLCNVLAGTYPDAELILMGVEEPLALIHVPNESVDPAEIAAMALTEALFLQRYAAIRS
jgi:hypothetical protein